MSSFNKSRKRAALGIALVVLFVVAMSPAWVCADPITVTIPIISTGFDPNQMNNSADLGLPNGNYETIPIDKHPRWAEPLPGSSWVSFGITGDYRLPGYFDVPNNNVISFFHQFYLPGEPTGGYLDVMADDTTAVYLNGSLLLAEATPLNNRYVTCSDFATGCLDSTASTVELMPYLITGWNVLQFDVVQRAGYAFGLNYAGIAIDPLVTPEPSTLALFSIGILALVVTTQSRRLATKPGEKCRLEV